MATPSDSRASRIASFQASTLSGTKELVDLVVVDLAAIERGLSLLERDLELGERGSIDVVARDASGRAVVIVCSIDPDPPIAAALDKCEWLSSHAPIVARIFAGFALDLSLSPRIVLLAPAFSPLSKRMSSLVGGISLTLVEWRHVESPDVHGLFFERVGEKAPKRSASPAVPDALRPVSVPRPAPSSVSLPAAAAPAVGAAPAALPDRPSSSSSSGAAPVSTTGVAVAPAPGDGARLYARAKERIMKIDPRIEPVESDDRADFLFLHKTLVELRRTSDELWLRVPPAETALPVRNERDLDRELHAVIEKFFRLYLSNRTDVSRPDAKVATPAEERDPLQPAKLTEEELREFYRLENGSNG